MAVFDIFSPEFAEVELKSMIGDLNKQLIFLNKEAENCTWVNLI